jgi:hypothetical protein
MHADRTPEAGDRASQAPGADGRVERAPVDAEPLCSLDHGEPLGRGRRGEEESAREVGGGHLLRHRRQTISDSDIDGGFGTRNVPGVGTTAGKE